MMNICNQGFIVSFSLKVIFLIEVVSVVMIPQHRIYPQGRGNFAEGFKIFIYLFNGINV